ncbi:helix-turn-helix transcriptional regulator [Ilumatobacter sp.]|uniref:helix-turn-helix transcriptional regulator n=1 Tax=Ilumatobacter sp. TaxID=1967498 RepID=UPI003B5247D8
MSSSISVPVAHALRVLRLLQANPGIGAAEIAGRLEISERAVRRYIATLRSVGISIDSTRGRYGGYRIGRSTEPPPLVFESGEVLGLVTAVLDGHHAAADPDDPVGSALSKLIASLPAATARQASIVRSHARAAPDRGAARSNPTVVTSLADALAEERRVRFDYTTSAGRTFEVDCDPWAVVVRHGRWYLLCHAHRPDATRSYRIDRITRLGTLTAATTTAPPADFDPVTALEAHMATGWEYDAVIDFDAPIGDVAPWVRPPMGRLEASPDGQRCRLRGTTSNPQMYASEWLAPIPHPFHVHGGPELRDAVHDVAVRLTNATPPSP